jgi:hypothetical protein
VSFIENLRLREYGVEGMRTPTGYKNGKVTLRN